MRNEKGALKALKVKRIYCW